MIEDGLTVHITHRGNNRTATYLASSDYEAFLWFLRFAAMRYEVSIHAYALMSNHFHVMATPMSSTALSRMMQSLGRQYVRYFNDRHGRTGTLWEGRYRMALITDERYWLTCMRYVEMNPVRAGIVTSPGSYRWSSYRTHALGAGNPLLTSHALFDQLASTPSRRQEAWRRICRTSLPSEQVECLRSSIAQGIVVAEPWVPADTEVR